MKLTIGMAVYDDFNGVYFTIQALRMYHDCSNVEFIVVDNNPASEHGQRTKQFVENWPKFGSAGAKYVPFPDIIGTTAPRNEVFKQATGDAVLCLDSHVLVAPGAIKTLMEWYDVGLDKGNLIQGPLCMDNFTQVMTHFDDTWRAQMWGIWGSAWEYKDQHFTVIRLADGTCGFRKLSMGHVMVDPFQLPLNLKGLPHGNHEDHLLSVGCKPLGWNQDDLPFEIPGQGLGLFSCRRDAWLGFNERFRGFGGEEMYIHEKFRQAGRKTLCFPMLKWGHRFGHVGGIPYRPTLTVWNKVRNYVLGHQELGLPLDRVYEHFVTQEKVIPQSEWDYLIATSSEAPPVVTAACPTGCGSKSLPLPKEGEVRSLYELYKWNQPLDRDLNKHFDKLREYAEQVDNIVEVTNRRESQLPFLVALPASFTSYQTEGDKLHETADALAKDVGLVINRKFVTGRAHPTVTSIPNCDLLYLDTAHTYDNLLRCLTQFNHQVGRFLIVRGTQIHGEKGEDGRPGLLPALREFMRKAPRWTVIYHSAEQYGITVLACQERDKPHLPSALTQIGNFTKALAEHVASGSGKVALEILNERLDTCSSCQARVEDRCTVCGCYMPIKATWTSSECPLGHWKR
jgi:hypothetical protein